MKKIILVGLFFLIIVSLGFGQVTLKDNFAAGDIILASDMNNNFTTIETHLNSLWDQAFWQAVTGGISYSGGNVGIGTDSPETKVHVNNGGIRIDPDYSLDFGNPYRSIEYSGGTMCFQSPDDISMMLDNDSNQETARFSITKDSNDPVTAIELFTILETGEVGIGNLPTAGAEALLHMGLPSDAVDEEPFAIFRASTGRTMQLLQPDPGDVQSPFTWWNVNAFSWRVDTIDAMIITDVGDLGIGTMEPDGKVEICRTDSVTDLQSTGELVISDTSPQIDLVTSESDHADWAIQAWGDRLYFIDGDVGDDWDVNNLCLTNDRVGINRFPTEGYALDVDGDFRVNGAAYCTSGVWASSDFRFKMNVQPISAAVDKIKNLNGVSFSWKPEEETGQSFPGGAQIGLIAQEVEKEFPELVATDSDGYKAVAYDKFTAVLLQAIKEQQEVIEAQEARLQALEERVKEMEGE